MINFILLINGFECHKAPLILFFFFFVKEKCKKVNICSTKFQYLDDLLIRLIRWFHELSFNKSTNFQQNFLLYVFLWGRIFDWNQNIQKNAFITLYFNKNKIVGTPKTRHENSSEKFYLSVNHPPKKGGGDKSRFLEAPLVGMRTSSLKRRFAAL